MMTLLQRLPLTCNLTFCFQLPLSESEEELKSLFMKVKEESEKVA